MNLLDLSSKYRIKITHHGDYDEGFFNVEIIYLTQTKNDYIGIVETCTLKKSDIDDLYLGVKQLQKEISKASKVALKKYKPKD